MFGRPWMLLLLVLPLLQLCWVWQRKGRRVAIAGKKKVTK